ncbi:NADP-dependent oxidoreductase [Pseudonocardia humida]|uniref:NADP-dependent oxidoreductase n=1 Tax=Pseudonocardia humida TaxID=2800819 RepID=A0ABT1A5J8_9PSEU|nr:NADP-dependent oxidoreductase [Pseudonocardia humida]MCO1658256.1 NADP-dependent oxidoreductase [Pseudonocardia humida]
MKAVQLAEHGGPEVLRVVEVEEPHAGPGEIRIAVRAAGVNALDWKLRQGFMPGGDLPAGTGFDAAGVVDEVGEGVTGVAVGDAVFGAGRATYAEHAVLTAWAPKPDALSFEEAAGYPTPVETGRRILNEVGVQPGQTLLVSGAAGGVGTAVVQLAKARGITVIGTAGEGNQEHVRSLGATPTTYGDGFTDRVRELAPGGVDAALDIAGSGVVPQLIELTGDPAKVLSIADFTAPQHGAKVSSTSVDRPAALAEAAELVEKGSLRIPVARAFPLAEAGEAQAASQRGHVTGRFVVTVP